MSYQAHYEVQKNSSPVNLFFVHGNLASRRWWYPVAEILTCRFKSAARVASSGQGLSEKNQTRVELNQALPGSMIFADLRGCGLSALPTPGHVNLEDLVDDMIAIAEKCELKNSVVVGHSAGGLIAALMLARRPDLFTGGLLIDPVGPTGLLGVPADIAEKYQMMASNRELAAQIIGFTIFNNDPNNEFFKTVIMDDSMSAIQHVGVGLVRALEGIDYSKEIANVKQPVIIFHGAHDWVLDEGRATDHQKLMSNSTFIKLPENGHCLLYENPERLAQEIEKFIL